MLCYNYTSVSFNVCRSLHLLGKCINELNEWPYQNLLQPNPEKTEVSGFGPKKERLEVSIHLDSLLLKTRNQARHLGVIME